MSEADLQPTGSALPTNTDQNHESPTNIQTTHIDHQDTSSVQQTEDHPLPDISRRSPLDQNYHAPEDSNPFGTIGSEAQLSTSHELTTQGAFPSTEQIHNEGSLSRMSAMPLMPSILPGP